MPDQQEAGFSAAGGIVMAVIGVGLLVALSTSDTATCESQQAKYKRAVKQGQDWLAESLADSMKDKCRWAKKAIKVWRE